MHLKRIIEISAAIISSLYVFTTLIINSIERAKVNSLPADVSVGDISEIANNLLANIVDGPILNIRAIDSWDNSCSGTIPTLFTWSTVDQFCQCSYYVKTGYCSPHSDYHCRNHSRVTFNLDTWKGKKICLDKLKSDDWKLSQGGSFSCPDGFKLCKGGVCVSKSILECPITDIIISASKPVSAEGNYKQVSAFTEGKSIFIARDIDKTPLTTFTVGIPSTPCINSNVGPLRTAKNSFSILRIPPVGCDKRGNYGIDEFSHIPVDSDSEWNFHVTNDVPYFSSLPGYRDYVGEERASLFARRKIEFKAYKGACMSYDYQSLKDVAHDLMVFENLRLGCNITCFVLCSIGVLLSILYIPLLLVSMREKNGQLWHMERGFMGLALVNAFILLILSAIAKPYGEAINVNASLMNDLADTDCFKIDGYNLLFDNLQTYILGGFPTEREYNSTNFNLSIAYFLFGTIFLLIKQLPFCKKFGEDEMSFYNKLT